jgi:hypothetical protein
MAVDPKPDPNDVHVCAEEYLKYVLDGQRASLVYKAEDSDEDVIADSHESAKDYLDEILKAQAEEERASNIQLDVILCRDRMPQYFVDFHPSRPTCSTIVWTHEPKLAKRIRPVDADRWQESILSREGTETMTVWAPILHTEA